MYRDFFGLREKPFELLPNPRFLYLSQAHKKACSYLQYGVRERAGFILLSGDVGSGKTTIVRDLIKKAQMNMSLSLVFNTRVAALQLLALINEDFGLNVEGKDKVTLLRELNDFLVAERCAGRRPVIIIDEAQNLDIEALEEVRLLSNFEAESFKLVQIILVGQPELKQLIARPELRQLRQRISIHCHLKPLERDELENYINYRLEIAGNRQALRFEEGVFDVIYHFSNGVPRLINVICDFLLLCAFVEGVHIVNLALAKEAMGELTLGHSAEGTAMAALPDIPPPGAVEPYVELHKLLLQQQTQLDELCREVHKIARKIDAN